AGDLTGCDPIPAVANYLNVDEVVADDDATYVRVRNSNTETDLYNLDNSGVGAGVITNVRVCVRAGYTEE
ncbi:unnamed protein product, partial [marine sediment metagenome]